MGESYEQGIEKAAKIIRDHNEGWAVWRPDGAVMAKAIVEAFLSAQPTIQWCEVHETTESYEGRCERWGTPSAREEGRCRIVEQKRSAP